MDKDFAVVVDRTCFSNLADLDKSLKTYGQEEADTGIVLHAIDVCKRDPFSELTISCSDTDVLLILLNYFEQLPSTTVFKQETIVTTSVRFSKDLPFAYVKHYSCSMPSQEGTKLGDFMGFQNDDVGKSLPAPHTKR